MPSCILDVKRPQIGELDYFSRNKIYFLPQVLENLHIFTNIFTICIYLLNRMGHLLFLIHLGKLQKKKCDLKACMLKEMHYCAYKMYCIAK